MRKLWFASAALAIVTAGFLAGAWVGWRSAAPATGSAQARPVLHYACPMHPQYHADRPSDCPTCGMRLEPVYADDPLAATGSSVPPGALKVPAEMQQVIGVRLAEVEKTAANHSFRTVGRVAVDPDRLYRLVAQTDGRVRRLYRNAAGTFVRKDEVLLSFYAPDLLTAEQAYLYALSTYERIMGDKTEPTAQAALTNAQLRSALDNLRNLGMSDAQVSALAKNRKIASEIEITSPVTGYVLARDAFPNQRMERGVELYRIADLSQVWVLADLFESEAQYIKPGAIARLSVPYLNATLLHARVAEALPQVDPTTRTLKFRLEIDNPGVVLKPDMLVDVEFTISLPPAVTVPVDAVVDSGARQTVFVDRGNGYFEPRSVETGWRHQDRVQILKGLMAGERIAVSGNFLLDSESRMRSSARGIVDAEIDPVCGMQVDRTKATRAGHARAYLGATYYFCSEQCRKQFDANAAQYAHTPPERLRPIEPAARRSAVGAASGEADPIRREVGESAREQARRATPEQAATPPPDIFGTDPVCGAEVDTTVADVLKSVHNGRTYYFFSADCKAEFDRNPAKYAVDAPTAGVPPARSPAPNRTGVAPTSHRTARDPVCGMDVDENEAAAAGLTGDYNDRTFYFCSEDCKKKFDAEPGKFVKK